MTCFCSFVGCDIFMRHFGDGVDTTTEINTDLKGNDNDIEELDEHEEEIDEDKESEGEELASESNDNGSDNGCDSNDLGYGHTLAFRQLWPISVLSHCHGHGISSANSVCNTHRDVIQSVSTCNKLQFTDTYLRVL
jgi:hypothetical protein